MDHTNNTNINPQPSTLLSSSSSSSSSSSPMKSKPSLPPPSPIFNTNNNKPTRSPSTPIQTTGTTSTIQLPNVSAASATTTPIGATGGSSSSSSFAIKKKISLSSTGNRTTSTGGYSKRTNTSIISSIINPFSSTCGSRSVSRQSTNDDGEMEEGEETSTMKGFDEDEAMKIIEEEKMKKDLQIRKEQVIQSINASIEHTRSLLKWRLLMLLEIRNFQLKSSVYQTRTNLIASVLLAAFLMVDQVPYLLASSTTENKTCDGNSCSQNADEAATVGFVRLAVCLVLVAFLNYRYHFESHFVPLPELDKCLVPEKREPAPMPQPTSSEAVIPSVPSSESAVSQETPTEKAPIPVPLTEMEEARKNLSSLGNGSNEELTDEQVRTIIQLKHDMDKDLLSDNEEMKAWCDYETCRRYLVARGWVYKKAYDQLFKSLQWRISTKPDSIKFEFSPKCIENPWALSMRMSGFDKDERPLIYTCFSQANDRYEVDKNVAHLQALIEEAHKIIRRRAAVGLSKPASSKQWIWVIDFDGFGLRDQNPNSAVQVGKLMSNYPEMLHMCILVDAPFLFSATWRLVQTVLDDRVRSKVSFVSASSMEKKLIDRIGKDAISWLLEEAAQNRIRRPKDSLKCYWKAPENPDEDHNPRGMKGYVDTEWYMRTPGDGWEDRLVQAKETLEHIDTKELVP